MKSSRVVTFLFLAIVFTIGSTAWAEVPRLMNFQGVLKDSSGNPVANGPYSVTFTIYDASSGGTSLWTETQSVTTSNGLFTVLLGSLNPVPDSAFQDTTRYLGVKVGADAEITPRQQLVSLSYAYRVGSVDGALGGNILTKVSIGPGHTNTGVNAFVAGENNTASGDYATVGGGFGNTASDFYTTVGEGVQNTASGYSSTVCGGFQNTASGDYSFAGGYRAQANNDATFVWGDITTLANFTSTAPNQFLIRAGGGVGIGTNSPATTLHVANSTSPAGITLGVSAAAGGYTALLTSLSAVSGGYASLQAVQSSGASYGDLVLNANGGNVGIGTTSPSEKLHVVGNICATGTIGACSDARYKSNLREIRGALNKVKNLHGIFFNWKRDEFPAMDFKEGNQVGFVAQELKEVLPEAISQGSDGYYSVDYGRLTPLLVEAIKEQQKQIEELKEEIAKLKNQPYQAQVEN